MSKIKDDYRPHTIILPSYCPVLICVSKHVAEDVADRLGYKNYHIQPTTKRDVECLIGEIQDLPNA